MSIFDLFKKKSAPAAEAEIKKEEKPKAEKKPRKPRAKKEPPAKAEPEVKVIKMDFDPVNPGIGSMELDWNKEFVDTLKTAGYVGSTDEDIVDAWLKDVCRTIAGDMPGGTDNIRYIQRRDVGGGKTEFS
jgi:hypothetical protein